MNIDTEHLDILNIDRVVMTTQGETEYESVIISDMPWNGEVYVAITADSNFANAIIERKHLEKFMKASKPAKKKKPTAQEKLKALKIGTRFTTETGDEWIKVGDDNFIETDEKLAIRGMKFGGFLQAEHFKGKITVIED